MGAHRRKLRTPRPTRRRFIQIEHVEVGPLSPDNTPPAPPVHEGSSGGANPRHAQDRAYVYHRDDPCSRLEGYWGNLNLAQEAALSELQGLVSARGLDLTPIVGDGARALCPAEPKELALLRFLRANKWAVEAALAQVEENLRWRREMDMEALVASPPRDVLGCGSDDALDFLFGAYYPHYHLGWDRVGRPVLVQQYGNFNTTRLKEVAPLEGLARYHAWEQEKNAELLRCRSRADGCLIETYTLILDFKGMGIGLVTGDFLWLLRTLSEMDRTYYPGRGGNTFIVNTPPLFGMVWAGIKGFMERTQARIHMHSREQDWKAALAEAIDPAHLPPEYGGTGPPLSEMPFLSVSHSSSDGGGAPIAAATAPAATARPGAPESAAPAATCHQCFIGACNGGGRGCCRRDDKGEGSAGRGGAGTAARAAGPGGGETEKAKPWWNFVPDLVGHVLLGAGSVVQSLTCKGGDVAWGALAGVAKFLRMELEAGFEPLRRRLSL